LVNSALAPNLEDSTLNTSVRKTLAENAEDLAAFRRRSEAAPQSSRLEFKHALGSDGFLPYDSNTRPETHV
jgi:hypothetical protein